MIYSNQATLIGAIGVSLLLAAFVMNLLHVLRAEGCPYMALNLVGAGLACYSSWLIGFMPFVVLEGVWAIAALGGLARAIFRPSRSPLP